MRSASSSARPDSLIPHVRRVRLRITALTPGPPLAGRGSPARSTISFISCGTPGTA